MQHPSTPKKEKLKIKFNIIFHTSAALVMSAEKKFERRSNYFLILLILKDYENKQ